MSYVNFTLKIGSSLPMKIFDPQLPTILCDNLPIKGRNYPRLERCNAPQIFLATEQKYLKVDIDFAAS